MTKHNLSDVEASLRAIAQRSVDAEEKFLSYAREHARLTRAQALTALVRYRKDRVIKFDCILGTFRVTHGGFLDVDVLRRAAGLE